MAALHCVDDDPTHGDRAGPMPTGPARSRRDDGAVARQPGGPAIPNARHRLHRGLRDLLIHVVLAVLLSGGAVAQSDPPATAAAPWPPGAPAASAASRAMDTAANARAVAASSLGRCIRRPPEYPIDVRREALEGRNVVTFVVSAEGVPGDPTVLRSSGHAALDNAALLHLRRCLRQFGESAPEPLPPGRYALPLAWRLE